MAKIALGKGLEALIKAPSSHKPPASPQEPARQHGERVQQAEMGKIVPSPFQPRKRFSEEPLDELVDSIRQHGVIQPLIVRMVSGQFELIAGERRWRASRKLGLTEVPVIVREASDKDVLEMALIENLQREDLNPIEEAEAFSRLAKEFDLTQEEIAGRVGKNRATVANAIRLLDLPLEVQSLVAQNLLSAGHAKAILALKDPDQQKLAAEMVIKKRLNVRATEKLVAAGKVGRSLSGGSGKGAGKKSGPELTGYLADLQDQLRRRFSSHVTLNHGDKKGKIEIEYYGDEDLERILSLLGVSGD